MTVKCDICFRNCRLEEGQTGYCSARQNLNEENFPLNYGRVTALSLDMIEKKPFMRFMPGNLVLTYGSFGCNMSCSYCNSKAIARPVSTEEYTNYLSPEQLSSLAVSYKENDNIGVAFSYNEPLVGYEYIIDTAKHLHKENMKVLVKTNGILNDAATDEVLEHIDAVNIDLKCFTENGYKNLGGDLRSVKRFIIKANKHAHVELTTLIIPDFNDSEEEMAHLSEWVAKISEEIPLHVSRFYPNGGKGEPTEPWRVFKAAETAKKNLKYVYTVNC